jgi:hypothetical protein
MKKIYLLTLGLVALLSTSVAQSDPDCPITLRAEWFTVPFVPPYCKLFITGGPQPDPTDPNASSNLPIVWLYTTNPSGPGTVLFTDRSGAGTPANPIRLKADGSQTIEYDCQFLDHIEIEYIVMSGTTPTSRECTYVPISGGPLPVKLTSFTGRLKTDNSVTLDWATAIEEASLQYEVQRSTDGKYFEKVGTLKAAGTSLTTIKYTFEDQLPSNGAYFYRLKQIDIDGKFEYSKVVYVNSKKGSGVITKVFPNPFKGEVQLIGATSSDLTPNNVQVFNIAGQRVTYRFMGANSILIDPSAPDGIYVLKVKGHTYKLEKNKASGTGY